MLYDAVVEDINDPLQISRVRVRVFGKHTDNTALIPIASLPWSQVMMPATSPSISGLGGSVCGLLPGSWVKVMYQDAEEQYPIVLGSFHGIRQDDSTQKISEDQLEFTDAAQEQGDGSGTLKDSLGNPVKDGSGQPVKTNTPDTKPAEPVIPGKVDPSKLGKISERYESGGRGPGVINNYKSASFGDLGGASYGVYQLASYLIGDGIPANGATKRQANNSTLKDYLGSSAYAAEFNDLNPATEAFDRKWKEIAANDSEGFRADQHKYIERTHYQYVLNRLPNNIRDRGLAIHEAIWSRSVQTKGLAVSLFIDSIGGIDKTVCDSKAVEILMDLAITRVDTNFASSSSGIRQSVKNRFADEKSKLIALARTYEKDCTGQVIVTEVQKVEYTEEGKKTTTVKQISEDKSATTPQGRRGFQDPGGTYPTYKNEADSGRMSRGVLTGTVAERKRRSIVTGKNTGYGTISEPVTQYNAKYPYNKTFETPSGHLIEMDDTPGYERLTVHHKSGSFVEFYPNGDIVKKTFGSDHEIIVENKHVIINGDCVRVIDGDSIEKVSGDMKLTINGDVSMKVNGDYTLDVSGNFKVKASKIDLN